MENPYRNMPDHSAFALALEELISWPKEKLLSEFPEENPDAALRMSTHFQLPANNGDLIVVRFVGKGANEKAARLRKLIDAWS